MKRNGLFFFVLFLFVLSPYVLGQGASKRERLSFNTDWRFQKDDPPESAGVLTYGKVKGFITATGNEFLSGGESAKQIKQTGNPGESVRYTQRKFDDAGWRHLDLPHDWGIEGPFKQEYPGETGKLPWWGVGWYRKHFAIGKEDSGRRIALDIDGAMAYSEVWVNGHFAGGWPYGYASFELDITPYLEFGGENVIAIRLDNPPESSRWYPGGGIYRNVWLVKTAAVHVEHWGTFVTTPTVSPSAATVNLNVAFDNDSESSASVRIKTSIYENVVGRPGERPVGVTDSRDLSAPVGSRNSVSMSTNVSNPKLWSPATPNMYRAVTIVEQNGKPIDRYETFFGIRTIKFDVMRGLSVNGEYVRINGVCDHHDLGALGSALNYRALQRQIEILKEMGVNAIRTSHNPPAPELLELCDKMGILVMDEAFDEWRLAKKENGYHKIFDDWHEKDVRAQIRRDRNHPSIILWSIGNEIQEQQNEEGHKVARELARIVREEDVSRPVTAAANYTQSGYNGFQKIVDVFGYNYKPGEYGKFRAANPTIPLFASETASTISSRGEYFFPVSNEKSQGKADFQMSSYDLYAPPWATLPDSEFHGQDEFPYTAGEFVWTGFDYLGEPTPYGDDARNMLNFTDPKVQAQMASQLKEFGKIKVPSRSSYFGIIDLCGFKKDRFYIYQARWRPEHPMAHILPHWNWPDRVGQVTPVHVYTSGDEAELFLNGRSLGRKKKGQFEYRLRWDDVKYEPGELKVVAYKNGKHWAEDVVRTTGSAEKLLMTADRSRIDADGRDLSFVTVTVADSGGSLVPRSGNHIRFSISGPGEIVAVDNGDSTDLTSFQSKERNAFNGLCLVVIRTKSGQQGQIKLTAKSQGLNEAEIAILSRAVK